MNHVASLKFLAAAALALGTLVTTTAHAQSGVQFSITLDSPGIYVQPASVYQYARPVYERPAPVYSYPQPVYEEPMQKYVNSEPIYVQSPPIYVPRDYGYGWEHHHHNNHDRHESDRGRWGGDDRDGTSDRNDRFPWNPNRR